MFTRRPSRARRGFTLLESMLALLLLGMLLLGAMSLYVSAGRTATRVHAQDSTGVDAANAIGRITDDAREAYYMDLPDDAASDSPSSFTPFGSYSTSDFETTVGSTVYDTGMQLTFPGTGSSTVYNSAGTAVTVTPTLYGRSAGSQLWIYRSDATGVPKPADGQYLWAYGTERGVSVNRRIARLSDGSGTPLQNAVMFDRPTDSSGNTLANEVEVRIIVSAFSLMATGGQQTNESGQTLLTGKCVLLRNHG